jgi:8-oxo-dGTP pyrophosphatase MutT (NUDIX family)
MTAEQLRILARRALREAPPLPGAAAGPSDYDLSPGLEADFPRVPEPRAAAVLVPVIARPNLTMLFTQRTDALPAHAGQIAFPGGKAEPFDRDAVDTALREAHEEIGLDRALAEPLGFLDAYTTGTGYRIIPVVALVSPDMTLTPDPSEVAATFEVPLDFLMDAGNHRLDSRIYRGQQRFYHAMPFEDHYIWGATAGILKNMHQRLHSA